MKLNKFLMAILFIACGPAALSYSQTVIFKKNLNEIDYVEVLRESAPYIKPNEKPTKSITTNSDGVVTTHSYTPISWPDRVDTFYPRMIEVGTTNTFTNSAIKIWYMNGQPDVKIVDVVYEPGIVIYYYQDWSVVGGRVFPGPLNNIRGVLFTQTNSKAFDRYIWGPQHGGISGIPPEERGLINARIYGSYTNGTLVAEVTYDCADHIKIQTNSFANGKWIISGITRMPKKE